MIIYKTYDVKVH